MYGQTLGIEKMLEEDDLGPADEAVLGLVNYPTLLAHGLRRSLLEDGDLA